MTVNLRMLEVLMCNTSRGIGLINSRLTSTSPSLMLDTQGECLRLPRYQLFYFDVSSLPHFARIGYNEAFGYWSDKWVDG